VTSEEAGTAQSALKPCKNCISLDDALKVVSETYYGGLKPVQKLHIKNRLKSLPLVIPEHKKARWIYKEYGEPNGTISKSTHKDTCSNCGRTNISVYRNYCPNCGSEMENPDEDMIG
jgi:uncharacterized paraquat-inducible protein A